MEEDQEFGFGYTVWMPVRCHGDPFHLGTNLHWQQQCQYFLCGYPFVYAIRDYSRVNCELNFRGWIIFFVLISLYRSI